MENIIFFLKEIKSNTKENELILMSNALTYRLLISIFPFIIFLMTLTGFFNIGLGEYIREISRVLPNPIQEILDSFLIEVIETKRISLLSTSFVVSIYSASTGFISIMQGLNRVYRIEDKRSFIIKRIISILLVFIFAFILTTSLLIFIFKDTIINILSTYKGFIFIKYFLNSLFGNIFITLVLLVMILIIYKISITEKISLIHLTPGALFTVLVWLLLSKCFNIYINNFSKYSVIYGSIGGIFVLVIWINMIAFILLLGGQINAIMQKKLNNILIEKD